MAVTSDGGGVVGSVPMWCCDVNEKALETEEAQGLYRAVRAVYGCSELQEGDYAHVRTATPACYYAENSQRQQHMSIRRSMETLPPMTMGRAGGTNSVLHGQ
jgi:hypothetical protein